MISQRMRHLAGKFYFAIAETIQPYRAAVACSQIDLDAVHWLNQPYDNFCVYERVPVRSNGIKLSAGSATGLNWLAEIRQGPRFSQSQSTETKPIPQPLRRHKTRWFAFELYIRASEDALLPLARRAIIGSVALRSSSRWRIKPRSWIWGSRFFLWTRFPSFIHNIVQRLLCLLGK